MISLPEVFLGASEPLFPSDAVVALLVLSDGRYIMQLRDLKPGIFFPGHWGLFGGAMEPAETEEETLRRELEEELGFVPSSMTRFVALDFDLSPAGGTKVCRVVYEVPVGPEDLATFALGEGTAFEALSVEDILTQLRVAPYDSFAIWLHHARTRLVRDQVSPGEMPSSRGVSKVQGES